MEIQRLLARAIAETGLECEIQAYDFRRGFVSNGVISMWRDANAFNEAGIPAVGYGPGTRDPIADGGVAGLAGAARPMAIDDLVATAKVFAPTALAICGVAG